MSESPQSPYGWPRNPMPDRDGYESAEMYMKERKERERNGSKEC